MRFSGNDNEMCFFSGGELFKEPYKLLYTKKKRHRGGVSSLGSLRSHLAPPCKQTLLPTTARFSLTLLMTVVSVLALLKRVSIIIMGLDVKIHWLVMGRKHFHFIFFPPNFFLLLLTLLNCFRLMEKRKKISLTNKNDPPAR